MLKATVLSLALVGGGSAYAYAQTAPDEPKAAQIVPAKPAPAQSAPKPKAAASTADKLAAEILAANAAPEAPAAAKPAAPKSAAAQPAAVTAATQTATKTDSAAKAATAPAAAKTAPATAQAAAKTTTPAAAPAASKTAPVTATAAAKTAPGATPAAAKTAAVAPGVTPAAAKAPAKTAAKKAKPKPKTIEDMAVDGQVSYTLAALTEWINASKDNRKLPFAVVDKTSAQIAVFDANGKLKALSPILIGSAAGDTSAEGVGDRELKDIPMEDRTTPAGRFVAGYGPASGHSKVLWIDYATAISIHPVLTTAAAKAEKRTQRLASEEPDDNRITHGCINVSSTFYANTIRSTFGKKGGVFYVIPDTISLLDAFPAYVPPGEEIIAAAEEPAEKPVAKVAAKPAAKPPAAKSAAATPKEKTATVKQAPAPAPKTTAQTATSTALE